MTAYATATDYATYKGVDVDDYDEAEVARINAGLLNAQDDIAALIQFAAYDPTDETITTALTRATCQQFDRAETTGDDGTGVVNMYQSTRIGSVSLSRSDNNGQQINPNAIIYSPRAIATLSAAGLLSGVVYHS